jgi:hypothetical protein
MIIEDLRLRQVILWQHEQALKLIGMVDVRQEGHDRLQRDFWENWYNDVFNIDTATDFGLGIWAQILKVNVSVDFDAQPDKIAFGYGSERRRYGQGNYGARDGSVSYLSTDQKRLLIRARYFSLTSKPTLDNINDFLRKYFWKGDAKVYVSDLMDMSSALYTFNYQPDGELSFLLENTDILPRPATVGVRVRIIGKRSFGYGEHRANYFESNYGVIGNG